MSPEQEAKFNELYEWMLERKNQQLTLPLDPVTQQLVLGGVVADLGNGGTALTQVYTDSRGDTVAAPKAYADTRLIKIGTVTLEIPYLAIT